jgi:hypothetical protein
MARCPECTTKIAAWQMLKVETKANPLVCPKCGAVLRTKPGWLVRAGGLGNAIAILAVPAVLKHSRGLGITMLMFLVFVGPLWACALFAPAEKAEAEEQR